MNVRTALLLSAVMVSGVSAVGQNSVASDIEQLKIQLAKQQKRIEALESALALQQEALLRASIANTKPIVSVAIQRSADDSPVIEHEVQKQNVLIQKHSQHPLSPKAQKVEDDLQRGPEIADVTPTTPALNLGPAKIRLIGYAALSNIYRSTNSGGNVATSFGSLPFDNTVAGNTSEFRLSAQRITSCVCTVRRFNDSPLPSPTVAVTSK